MLLLPSFRVEGAIVFSDDFEYNPTNINGGADGQWRSSSDGSGAFDASKWTVAGTGDVTGTDQYSFTGPTGTYLPPQSGRITAAFYSTINDGTVAMASLSTDVPTIVGMTYDVHFWISNPIEDSNARQNLFSVSWNGTLLNLSSDPRFTVPSGSQELAGGTNQYVVQPNTNWFEVVFTNLAPSAGATTNLTFSGQNNNWATLVDSVIIEETPEPSTVVMLFAGAALLGARRRRQQRVS